MRLMEEELKVEKANEDFERRREEAKRKDEAKTEKNRRKREKRKAAKEKNAPTLTQKHGEGISADEDMAVNPLLSQKPYPPKATLGGTVVDDTESSQMDRLLSPHPEESGVIIHDEF